MVASEGVRVREHVCGQVCVNTSDNVRVDACVCECVCVCVDG